MKCCRYGKHQEQQAIDFCSSFPAGIPQLPPQMTGQDTEDSNKTAKMWDPDTGYLQKTNKTAERYNQAFLANCKT